MLALPQPFCFSRKRHRELDELDEERGRSTEKPAAQKAEDKEKELAAEEPKRTRRDPSAQPELPVDKLQVLRKEEEPEEAEEEVDLNHLQAQALKAELMGDTDRYNELQEKIRRIESKPKVEVIVMDGVGELVLSLSSHANTLIHDFTRK